MPGRLLFPVNVAGGGEDDGVYKLTFLGSSAAGREARLGSMTTVSGSRNAFMGHRYHNVEYSNSEQQQSVKVSSSNLEAPEMEHFASISEDDELLRLESTFRGTRTSNVMTIDDDAMLTEFTSRHGRTSDCDSSLMSQEFASRSSLSQDVDFARARHSTAFTTSHRRTSDEDSSLMDFASRSSTSQDTVDFSGPQQQLPARHSTACCSDLAFRRELRKRLQLEQSTADANVMRRDSTSTFTLGNSFRRELLEKEDRVESLALWEESSTDHKRPLRASARNISSSNLVAATSNATPHSWHAGDTAAASRTSARNKNLDAILGRNKKKSSSFFNGFFSNLSFLSSRKSRKSSSR